MLHAWGIVRMFTSLGFGMTKRKLAQAVPIVSVRLRFLTEKYDQDPDRCAPDSAGAETVDIPLVDEVLDAEPASDSGHA